MGFILNKTKPGFEIQVREEVSIMYCVQGQSMLLGNHNLFLVKVEAEIESELS